MKKIKLPLIIESAKKRPLSLDPKSGTFIYYDDIQTGHKKLIPIDKLNHEQLIKLAIERQVTNEPGMTVTLNGEKFTNEQLAHEIKMQSKIGKQMFRTDIDYLKYYLTQFPKESFDK